MADVVARAERSGSGTWGPVVVGRRERVEIWGVGLPGLVGDLDPSRAETELAVSTLCAGSTPGIETVRFAVAIDTDRGTRVCHSTDLEAVETRPDGSIVVAVALEIAGMIWSGALTLTCDPKRSGVLSIGADVIGDRLWVDHDAEYLVSRPLSFCEPERTP